MKYLIGIQPTGKLHIGNYMGCLAKKYHKITDIFTNKIITLFITDKRFNEWGYDVDGKFIGHKEYRILKNENKL